MVLVQALQHRNTVRIKVQVRRTQQSHAAQLMGQSALSDRKLSRIRSIQTIDAVHTNDSRLHDRLRHRRILQEQSSLLDDVLRNGRQTGHNVAAPATLPGHIKVHIFDTMLWWQKLIQIMHRLLNRCGQNTLVLSPFVFLHQIQNDDGRTELEEQTSEMLARCQRIRIGQIQLDLWFRNDLAVVLRPMRRNGSAHLHEAGQAMAIDGDLLGFHLIGDVAHEIGSALQVTRSRKSRAAPSDQAHVDRTTEYADVRLADKPVDYLQHPIALHHTLHWTQQKCVPHEAFARRAAKRVFDALLGIGVSGVPIGQRLVVFDVRIGADELGRRLIVL